MTDRDFLTAAHQAADAAAEIIQHYYTAGVAVSYKSDTTPVTQADIESEHAILDVLRSHFPEHGFYGEETGQADLDAEYLWLIDPIDGTKSFVRGYPFFSTQIALMRRGELIMGLSNASVFGQRAWAQVGQGAYLNGDPLKVATTQDWSAASVSTGNLKSLATSTRWSALGELLAQANRTRGYGDFYHYHLLAQGSIDVVIESDLNILDIAALAVIVREAGGQVSDLAGQPLTLATRDLLAACTPVLHHKALQHLAWAQR